MHRLWRPTRLPACCAWLWLVAACPAQVATRPDDDAWPDSAAATAASVGVSSVEPGRWVHRVNGPDRRHPGDANGKVLMQAGTLPASISIDPTDGAGAPFPAAAPGLVYTASLWVCARPTGDVSPATGDAELCRLSIGSQTVRTRLALLAGTTPPETLGVAAYAHSGSADDQGLFGAGRDAQLGYLLARPMFRLGDWVHLSITLRTGADGSLTVAINGQAVSRRVNLDTTAATAANLNGGWTLTFPAWAGVAFEVAGIESWRGPDWPGFESPVPSPERYDCAWRWPMKFVDGGVGAPWTVSGDVPAATVAYGSDNVQPWRTRLVAGGAAGQSLTVRSTGSLGTLPFNSDGWATLCWPMVRCSSPGLSWRLGVEQAGGAAGAAVTVEQGRVRWPLPDGGTAELATNGGDVRWAVSLHLHRDGRAAVSAVNMTDWYQSLTGSAAFSSALPAWHTAGDAPPLGHVTMDGAFGAPGTLECDGLSVHRWLTLAMVDSYTSAPTTGLAPLYHCADSNNAGAYSCLEDAFSPGHFAAYAPIDGGPVWQFPFTTGRSGSTTYLWGRHVLPGMAAARGVRYVMFGGVVNDVSLCGTPEQAAWIQQMSPPVLQSLIGSLAERESAFTWVLPVIGQAPNFHNERSLECFRSIWDAAAGAHCTGENARRFTVALPGPVWMPDGVHYLYNSGRVAAYTARSLQQRPACGTMPCGVADMGRQGGAAGADGAMDNNDFIVFIDRFFLGSLLADVSGQGALINPDGRLDNNDFVVFIDLFFTDCMR